MLGPGDELHDTGVNRLGRIHNPECTPDDQHESNDSRLLGETLIKSRKHLPGLRNTARYKPSGCCTKQQHTENYYICIRNSHLDHS